MNGIKRWSKTTKSNIITYGIVLAFYLLIEGLLAGNLLSNSFQGMLVPVCAYVVLAVSLNLTVGILGELSLGHAGFMSVGAFSGAVLWVILEGKVPDLVGLVLAMLLGGVVAGVFGFLIGIPVLRLRGDYLAIVTLAFGEIIKNILNALYLGVDASGLHVSLKDSAALGLDAEGTLIINGAIGISGMKKISSFTAGIILVLVALAVILNLIHSRAGRAIMAIRDNRIAAEAMGINITKYKLMAFITSAVFAGMAGVLYALNYTTLAAKKFDYNTSILVLVFVVLGGIGNIRGSIIAATILYILPELLRGLQDYRMLVYAVVLIFMMIFNQSPQVLAWRSRMGQIMMNWPVAQRFASMKQGKKEG
ncbi:MAG: branched-chain amino acid ABC transporter permease [Candidatus Fournierella pullistercoris]|uniref:Branched-chain amino acid ABC transporter permease n=1 Tax=Candidatus Allofournierella pullistercoris TaxID=2838597 RepID=A0A948WQ35_9FIRM|nr:branched-chain amino acid ABC transporter permease [Candidatus Fournierella pullistercoris]